MKHMDDAMREQTPYEPSRKELEQMDSLRAQAEQELKNKGLRE